MRLRSDILVFILLASSVIPVAPADYTAVWTGGRQVVAWPASSFLENAGQIRNGDVRYYVSSGGLHVGFAESSVLVVLVEHPEKPSESPGDAGAFATPGAELKGTVRGVLVRIAFDGSNQAPPRGRGELPQRTHYFLGGDPAKWRTNVPSYREIVYENLFDGIDLVYRVTGEGLKYEFVVRPEADPARIRWSYDGIETLYLSPTGDLLARTSFGVLRDAAPSSFQGEREVRCSFALRGLRSVGMDCEAWDRGRDLVIDPLVYGTYLGGGGPEYSYSVAVDAAGNAFVVGGTEWPDFPATPGAFDASHNGLSDGFVAKLDPSGTALVYASYLGGSGWDKAYSVTVDSEGYAYVAGATWSSDFPITSGSFDPSHNGQDDVFVAKLDPAGSVLVWSTFLGGSGGERPAEGKALVVDPTGEMYVTGYTTSSNFPTTRGALDRDFNGGGHDAFVAKFDAAGSTLRYATYLGGGGYDDGRDIAVESGNAYVTGYTESADFPVSPGAFDTRYDGAPGAGDGYVAKLDVDGGALLYATFLGGSRAEDGEGLAVDETGSAYVTGVTSSEDFPATLGAFDTSYGGGETWGDAYVAKLNPTGGALVYATYLGGRYPDDGVSIALDATGSVYVTGRTFSDDFPLTPGAFDTTYGWDEAYIAKLSPNGDALLYGTYLGGQGADLAESVSVGPTGDVYLAGFTDSTDFPTTADAFDTTHGGGVWDAFVARLNLTQTSGGLPDLTVSPGDISFNPPGPVSEDTSVQIDATIHNIGGLNATQVRVRFQDGPSPSPQIGTDQLIPTIPPGGAGTAAVAWTAGPPGTHTICVVADPDNTVAETNEGNNEGCAPLEVLAFVGPDLAVSPSDIVLSPSPPYTDGDSVRFEATIHNVGANASDATVARFHDGVPPSLRIGADQPLPILPPNGTATVSVTWTATPPGSHSLCVVADPDDVVAEGNETNNIACVSVTVEARPEVRPDYVPLDPSPSGPVTTGLSRTVTLTIRVLNVGNATANATATLAFYNESAPAIPVATFAVPPLGPGEATAAFSAMWTAPATPGSYVVVAATDYGDLLLEWNETNNANTWTIVVVPGPYTALVVGAPNYTTDATYVTSATPLSLLAVDKGGTGIRTTAYRVDAGPWIDYAGPFTLVGEGGRPVEWFSEDFAGNIEPVQSSVLRVDDTPPETALAVGDPKYLRSDMYVTSATLLSLTAADGGVTPVGVARTEYRVDGSPWQPYAAPFSVMGEGTHAVEYRSVDLLANEQPVSTVSVVVDDTPPTVSVDVGDPKYTGNLLYVGPAARIALSAEDGGVLPVGFASLAYRVDESAWASNANPFALPLPDGAKRVEYHASDLLGNEAFGTVKTILDSTPPGTTHTPATGPYTQNTVVTLTATDGGSGVARTEYRVDGGPWILYGTGFALPLGRHVVAYRSVDNVGNVEAERTFTTTVESALAVGVNWKPFVAIAFAAILAIVGLWSSRHAPWKGRPGREEWRRAFVATSLPFVLGEVGTGIVSYFTGLFLIPPILGVGTAIDLAILIAGAGVAIYRIRKWTPPEFGEKR